MASRLLIAWIMLSATTDVLAQTEHRTLTIGESIDITLRSDNVTVSRKGVVDLFHRGDGRWTLTGLKRGFVLIKALPLHYKITVVDHATESRDPHDLCRIPRAKCDSNGIRITGVYNNPRDFFTHQTQCEDIAGCRFQATLSIAAQGQITTLVGQATPAADGRYEITVYCGDGEDPYEAYPDWLRSALKVVCVVPEYQVTAHFLSLSDSELDRLGITYSTRLLATEALGDLNLRQIVDARLIARRQLVATPSLQILAGKEATVEAGGEFYVAGSNPEHAGSWRKFGMQLTFTVVPLHQGRSSTTQVRLRYRVKLTGRGADTSLAGNLTEAEVSLPLSTEKLVAQIPFYVSQNEEAGSSLLADVPLIGPLFRTGSHATDVRQLFVFFQITKS